MKQKTKHVDILRLAKEIALDYWKSKEFKSHPNWVNMPANWDKLTVWNQGNFIFVARWHLSRMNAMKSHHRPRKQPELAP